MMSDPEFRIQFKDRKGEIVWQSNPGPQTWALLCPYDEILIGGRRGGSKSEALKAWLAMGDLTLSDDDPAKYSYLNEPSFRALIVREEYQQLEEFIDECEDFFRHFGGKATGKPRVIEFKSGAKILFRHLGDKEAYNQARGWGLTKIGIEELTLVPEENWYLKLFGSLRGKKQIRVHNGKKFPALHTQIMSSTNPDGPGHLWVKKRFVKVYGGGQLIPWNTPMRDPISGLRRIFIPMRREDNPHLRDSKQYEGMLLAQDEMTRKQWMDGDWEAGSGQFFSEWRPDGPIGEIEKEKYPWARHKIESAPLQPWWFRWLGGDWGFSHNAVFHKMCRNEQDKRIHVYDELKLRQVGSYEMGVLIAKWCLPELEALPDHQMTLYFSPDAFSKTDETKTKAEQLAMGIQEVLGPYGSMLLRYNDDERQAAMRDPKAAALMFQRRRAEAQGKMCIAIKPANNDRVAGWSYMRELLRFRPVLNETEQELRDRLSQVFATAGVEAYERELAAHRKVSAPEALPKVQIWKVCKLLDEFMSTAQHDEAPRAEDVKKFDATEGVGGDDAGDSARYGLVAYKEIQTTIPQSYWVNERISQFQQQQSAAFGSEITDPTRLAQIQRMQSALYAKNNPQSGGGITLPRHASMRHRVQ
jgi:hypothetical protein